jgi:iron(III) transport system ATP-binding protein
MLKLEGLAKSFGPAGIQNVSFEVNPGEFFTILGPSGCGKTTTLRCIAGLETPTDGTIEINGQTVYCRARNILIPTAKRDIGMVFQSYAIWPHMTVRENVAFPLTVQNLTKSDIRDRTTHALTMVGLEGLHDRPAPLLSGGQQQRVALARAIAKGASLLLLDEPLSNLDATLREQMRAELRDLQKRTGITAIYVTHDQEEALSLSDRIAIMRGGLIVDIDAPMNLYFAPKTIFAAEFIGRAEILPCHLLEQTPTEIRVQTPLGPLISRNYPATLTPNLALSIRPEHIEIAPQKSDNNIQGTIQGLCFTGRTIEYEIQVETTTIRVQRTSEILWEPNTTVTLRLPPNRCRILNDVPPPLHSGEGGRGAVMEAELPR